MYRVLIAALSLFSAVCFADAPTDVCVEIHNHTGAALVASVGQDIHKVNDHGTLDWFNVSNPGEVALLHITGSNVHSTVLQVSDGGVPPYQGSLNYLVYSHDSTSCGGQTGLPGYELYVYSSD